ncbi:hypothetical protein ANAEL_03703 [Anaerolineales bacterium]|nr:hypothetical protein ANAEL_03703 [Anaerolineales bacterium]
MDECQTETARLMEHCPFEHNHVVDGDGDCVIPKLVRRIWHLEDALHKERLRVVFPRSDDHKTP